MTLPDSGNRVPVCNRERGPACPDARPAGVSIQVNIAKILESGPARDRTSTALNGVLDEGFPLTVRPTGLSCTDSVQAFGALCELVARTAARSSTAPERIAIAVDGHDITPERAWSLRRQLLGRGMLYFIGTDIRPDTDTVLRRLWKLRFEACVSSAFWPLVRSPGPLLDNEGGDDVLPLRGIQAPPSSAWVSAIVDIGCCLSNGALSWSGFDTLLSDALHAADDEHTRCRWPTAATRHDAWLNRRVAVEIVGIGDWVATLESPPCSLRALSAVDTVLAHAATRLKTESRSMSKGNTLPAIAARDPCRRLPAGSDDKAWRQRWEFAIDRAGLSHRNLLVVSPWSLFPARRADVRAFNLLPVLRHVDACTFRRKVSIDHWSVNEYRDFHRRAWAVMRQNARPALIAEQL